MTRPVFVVVFAMSALATGPAAAQPLRPSETTGPAAVSPAEGDGQVWLAPEQFPLDQPGLAVPFRSIGRDFGHFFGSQDNLKLLALFGGAALAGHQWDDDEGMRGTHMADRPFTAGNIGGGTAAQAGLAVGTWVIGRATGSRRMSAVGADLIEAQVVAQTVIQGLKHTVQRERPDGSDNRSFPSGHTGSAFATATVLQRHFGWKVGAPAYAFGAYVGAARIATDKHHLSDVLLGAGIGLVAGRSVTMGIGGHRFDVGVTPTTGRGAMVTFSRN